MFIFEPKANTDITGILGLVLMFTLKFILSLNFLLNLISVPAPVKKETLESCSSTKKAKKLKLNDFTTNTN